VVNADQLAVMLSLCRWHRSHIFASRSTLGLVLRPTQQLIARCPGSRRDVDPGAPLQALGPPPAPPGSLSQCRIDIKYFVVELSSGEGRIRKPGVHYAHADNAGERDKRAMIPLRRTESLQAAPMPPAIGLSAGTPGRRVASAIPSVRGMPPGRALPWTGDIAPPRFCNRVPGLTGSAQTPPRFLHMFWLSPWSRRRVTRGIFAGPGSAHLRS